MDQTNLSDNVIEQWWEEKKSKIISSIKKVKQKGSVDEETLYFMEELLEMTKVKKSIQEYFKEEE